MKVLIGAVSKNNDTVDAEGAGVFRRNRSKWSKFSNNDHYNKRYDQANQYKQSDTYSSSEKQYKKE